MLNQNISTSKLCTELHSTTGTTITFLLIFCYTRAIYNTDAYDHFQIKFCSPHVPSFKYSLGDKGLNTEINKDG